MNEQKLDNVTTVRFTDKEKQQIEEIRSNIIGNTNLTYTDSEIIRMSVDYLHDKLCYQKEKPNPQYTQYKDL